MPPKNYSSLPTSTALLSEIVIARVPRDERRTPTRHPALTYAVTFPEGSLAGHCSEKLTKDAAFRVKKVPMPGQKSSWARAEVKENPLDEAYIRDQISKPENNKPIEEKWAALDELQHKKINALLSELNSEEMDKDFE